MLLFVARHCFRDHRSTSQRVVPGPVVPFRGGLARLGISMSCSNPGEKSPQRDQHAQADGQGIQVTRATPNVTHGHGRRSCQYVD